MPTKQELLGAVQTLRNNENTGNSIDPQMARILELVLSTFTDQSIENAQIFIKIQDSLQENPDFILGEESKQKFRARFQNPEAHPDAQMPDHKASWYLEVIDLIARGIQASSDRSLSVKQIEELVGFTDMYDREYVLPDVQTLYDDPKNWRSDKGYQGQMSNTYIGPHWVAAHMYEHNRFRQKDLQRILLLLNQVEEFRSSDLAQVTFRKGQTY